jgi:hypothetical protein
VQSRCGFLSPGATAWLPCRSGAVRFREQSAGAEASLGAVRARVHLTGAEAPLGRSRGPLPRTFRSRRSVGGAFGGGMCRNPSGPKALGSPCLAEAGRGRHGASFFHPARRPSGVPALPKHRGADTRPDPPKWAGPWNRRSDPGSASSVARGRDAAEGEAPKRWTLSLPSRAEARSGKRGDTSRVPRQAGGVERASPRRGTRQGDGSGRGRDGTTILKGCGHVKEQSELVECFRSSLSFLDHRISPLPRKYRPPRLSLFEVYMSCRQALFIAPNLVTVPH